MIIENITKEDYTIVQIGFENDIRMDMQKKIKQLYNSDSPIKDFSLYHLFDNYELRECRAILDWQAVSSNQQIKWSKELINEFKDKWDYSYLWLNHSILCWDAELLEEYKDRIVWELIVCNSIEWTRELHDKFEKYLPPSSYIDYNMIREHTTNNRNRFLNNQYYNFTDTFNELFLYAKSIDKYKGILILYDSIRIYFNNKL